MTKAKAERLKRAIEVARKANVILRPGDHELLAAIGVLVKNAEETLRPKALEEMSMRAKEARIEAARSRKR